MQNSHQDRGQRDREEGGLAGQDPAQTSQRQPKHLSKPVGKQPENCRKKKRPEKKGFKSHRQSSCRPSVEIRHTAPTITSRLKTCAQCDSSGLMRKFSVFNVQFVICNARFVLFLNAKHMIFECKIRHLPPTQ